TAPAAAAPTIGPPYSGRVTPSRQVAAAKRDVRSAALVARRARAADEVRLAAHRLADRVGVLVAERGVRCVSAYVSLDGEPGTHPLLERLDRAGIDILLPVLLPGRDLDWALYQAQALEPGPLGLTQPTTPRLGVDGLQLVDLVICPGVAGSVSGQRLGRGGGSYDRALVRSRATSPRCLLLYDDEVLDAVPTDAHDQPIDILITPTRTLWTSAGRL
ncbi:MAG: 5-formyltetrahydrofolate cyclo-ligase, partial [Nocardioidaceae bacterium]|nr:5-formyltetrahydrofolate cyclo-ligase [Nocardioidaceae bacterium]